MSLLASLAAQQNTRATRAVTPPGPQGPSIVAQFDLLIHTLGVNLTYTRTRPSHCLHHIYHHPNLGGAKHASAWFMISKNTNMITSAVTGNEYAVPHRALA